MFIKVDKSIKVVYEPVMFQTNFWGYNIKIENIGGERLTVINNYWQIPNDTGSLERVDEDCVKDLSLNPGDTCEIMGFPPLQKQPLTQQEKNSFYEEDPSQEQNFIVIGSYTLEKESGEKFDLHIPFFSPNHPPTSETIH